MKQRAEIVCVGGFLGSPTSTELEKLRSAINTKLGEMENDGWRAAQSSISMARGQGGSDLLTLIIFEK